MSSLPRAASAAGGDDRHRFLIATERQNRHGRKLPRQQAPKGQVRLQPSPTPGPGCPVLDGGHRGPGGHFIGTTLAGAQEASPPPPTVSLGSSLRPWPPRTSPEATAGLGGRTRLPLAGICPRSHCVPQMPLSSGDPAVSRVPQSPTVALTFPRGCRPAQVRQRPRQAGEPRPACWAPTQPSSCPGGGAGGLRLQTPRTRGPRLWDQDSPLHLAGSLCTRQL